MNPAQVANPLSRSVRRVVVAAGTWALGVGVGIGLGALASGPAAAVPPLPVPAFERALPAEPWRPPLAAPADPLAVLPAPREGAPTAPLAPDPERARALRVASGWLARAGDAAAALDAAEGARALAARPLRADEWRTLAHLRLAAGEAPAAETAWLRAVAAGGPEEVDSLVELGRLYSAQGRTREALDVLEEARRRAPGSPIVWAAVLDWPTSTPVARPAVAAAPPLRPAPPTRFPVAEAIEWVRARLPHPLLTAFDRSAAWMRGAEPVQLTAVAVATLALLLLAPQWLRQRGDLAVALRYPEELRGTFRLRVARKRRQLRPRSESSSTAPRAEVLKGGISSRTEHHLVSRETHFPRLPSRRYFVLVEGILEDPDGGEVLSDIRELKVVRVRHRRTVRCEFDLRPTTCPVDVSVTWDESVPRDVMVAVAPGGPVPADIVTGRVRIHLPKGAHTLVVGSGDRVLEHHIDVETFQPTRVSIDIAQAGDVLFRGCPPAVDPYLRGDLAGAARALEREGQMDAAHSVLARAALAEGRLEVAADHFESSARPRLAAELREQLGQLDRAAQLYLEADDPIRAARMYRESGQWVRAGEAYESARDFDAAIECYEEAGEISKQVDALDRRGDTYAAAVIALDNGWRARGIRLLRLVSPQSSHFADACLLLADAFEREGHWDLAAQKLEEHINAVGSAGSSPDLQWRLAEMLENAGHVERALSLLEELRRSEPTYPNVAARIELLRKKRSTVQVAAASSDGSRSGSGDFAPPTMFLSDQRYEIIEEIGRGAMGVVFKGRDRRLSRVVALKRLPDSLLNYPRAVQLFLREAQATARLNHRNIVTVYDADQEDGAFFITMELLEGQPLHQRLRELGRIPVDEVLEIGLQVAEGLDYAHGQGVIHRDIKTANLFRTDDGVVKITDFGLAKMMEEVRRAETRIGGTPFYMAPEQVAGGEVDPRADVYSFGATLFEMVTGRVPFSEGDVTYHHRHTPPPDPRELASEMPDALAELILDMLAKSPDDRPPSAHAVYTRLEAVKRSLDQTAD